MNIEHIDDILVIELPNRLDARGVSAIEDEFSSAITTHRGKTLVDMSDVEFAASMALRMLMISHKSIKQQGGEIRLCSLQPRIAEIFRKSRFDTLFAIHPDRAAALAAFQA